MFGKFARQRTAKGKDATIDPDSIDSMNASGPGVEVERAIERSLENPDVTDEDERLEEERQTLADEYESEEHHANLENLRDCANETQSIEQQDHPFMVSYAYGNKIFKFKVQGVINKVNLFMTCLEYNVIDL